MTSSSRESTRDVENVGIEAMYVEMVEITF